MSFDDRLDVPLEKSRASTRATFSPRSAASRAVSCPVGDPAAYDREVVRPPGQRAPVSLHVTKSIMLRLTQLGRRPAAMHPFHRLCAINPNRTSRPAGSEHDAKTTPFVAITYTITAYWSDRCSISPW